MPWPLLFFLTLVAGIAIGLVAGAALWRMGDGAPHKHRALRLAGYRFVNPLLECEIAQEYLDKGSLPPFRHKVETLIRKRIAAGDVQNVSVYYRDLQDGPWFGINEEEQFSPASLMKLPVLIAYLKQAEENPGVLTARRLTYDDREDWNDMQNIKPAVSIEPGKSYTVDDLLYRMLVHSDNNAWHVLFKNIDYRYLDRILHELNVNYDPNKEEDFMSVRAYSSLLRVLYNATYLSKPMSEKALELLAHVDFKDGIVAGVPAGVPVASKFGERTLGNNREIKQLHEFGIVYYPENHYLLGIMTRGSDFAKLGLVLRDISRLVYAEVDAHSRNLGKRGR